MAQRTRKPKTLTRIALAVLALIVVVSAAFAYIYRDRLFGSSAAQPDGSAEPYTYEYGAQQQFAVMENGGLAISSSTGLQILDRDGYTLTRQVFSMKNPAVHAGKEHCVFYDVGGTALRLYSGGDILELDTKGNIISVSMNANGYIAVSCEESGYKGAVTIYDNAGNDVFKWNSGSGYVLDAAVSPDNNSFAILCVESSGSVVHIFERRSTEEKASVSLSGELSWKLNFTDNNSFCTLSESALRFYKTNGDELQSMDFGGMTLTDFCLTEKLCAVALSKYVTGGEVTLTSLSSDGRTLGTVDLSTSPLALSANGTKLMSLGAENVTVFSQDLTTLSTTGIPSGYNSAVYLPDGSFLLLSSYHGERIFAK